jgi:hypothetical protein
MAPEVREGGEWKCLCYIWLYLMSISRLGCICL